MGYVGNQTTNSYSSMDKQTITGNGGASYTLTHSVANAQEIEVFVNNVRQEPGVAYTVSGTALTMTGNVASTDDFYVIYQGKALQTTVPPDDSVTTARINDGAVTNAKINTMAASKLTGALPAIDGSSLTGTGGFTFESPVATNGQSAATFTSIPSGVDIIKFGLWRVSSAATATLLVRIGDSGGLESSGYARHDFWGSSGQSFSGAGASSDTAWTLDWSGHENILMHSGELIRVQGNKWIMQANGIQAHTTPNYWIHWGGYKELSAELTQISFFFVGTTFDDANGYVRIGYA